MIDKNLVNYIQQNLNKGYDINSIKNTLINQGYPSQNVNDTINYIQSNEQTPQQASTRQSSKKWIFILMPIILVAIVAAIFVFIGSDSNSGLVEGSCPDGSTGYYAAGDFKMCFPEDSFKYIYTCNYVQKEASEGCTYDVHLTNNENLNNPFDKTVVVEADCDQKVDICDKEVQCKCGSELCSNSFYLTVWSLKGDAIELAPSSWNIMKERIENNGGKIPEGDFDGLECLQKINLGIISRDVSDVSALSSAIGLKEIRLRWTKVDDLSPLRNLPNLETAHVPEDSLCEDIPNVQTCGKYI